jgi:hypothetical protein
MSKLPSFERYKQQKEAEASAAAPRSGAAPPTAVFEDTIETLAKKITEAEARALECMQESQAHLVAATAMRDAGYTEEARLKYMQHIDAGTRSKQYLDLANKSRVLRENLRYTAVAKGTDDILHTLAANLQTINVADKQSGRDNHELFAAEYDKLVAKQSQTLASLAKFEQPADRYGAEVDMFLAQDDTSAASAASDAAARAFDAGMSVQSKRKGGKKTRKSGTAGVGATIGTGGASGSETPCMSAATGS